VTLTTMLNVPALSFLGHVHCALTTARVRSKYGVVREPDEAPQPISGNCSWLASPSLPSSRQALPQAPRQGCTYWRSGSRRAGALPPFSYSTCRADDTVA